MFYYFLEDWLFTTLFHLVIITDSDFEAYQNHGNLMHGMFKPGWSYSAGASWDFHIMK